jgi:Zn-dependent metalloprotease
MKARFLLLNCLLFLVSITSIGQTYSGEDAEHKIEGAKTVRIVKGSSIPDFIELKESSQFPASMFEAWANKAFELDESIGFHKESEETDKLGFQHTRYHVTKNGIDVFGAFVYTHGSNDLVKTINGKFPKSVVERGASIQESAALQSAKDFIGAEIYKWELQDEEEHLKWETEHDHATYFPKGELVYINPAFNFAEADAFRLAYRFDIYAHKPVGRYKVFVDAQTGEVLFKNDRICSADSPGTAVTGHSGNQGIITDSFGGGFRLREAGRGGGVRTFDMNEGTNYGNAVDFTDGDNFWNNANGNLDQYATDAHWGAEMTYDYYLNEHGRNSIDNANMQINSYVHYDQGYFNAFWDGQRMTYGDGNNSPLTALDICGHEMTHGVTEFSAGLIYQDEYGALNESFSDIFGAAVEFVANPSSGDWLMGEDVGTLRSMINPNQYGDPDTYNGTNWYTGTADNGGVHINSGVQNKWFQILVDGESGTNDLGDSYSVTGIGLDDAAAIAYRNLTVYLGPTSEYVDARFYAIQSAIDLFGGCSPQVIACTNAWYAVGVGDEFDATVTADFSAAITASCEAPFTVQFANESANGSTYDWDFGDGNTSTDLNPIHTYSAVGDYTVSLSVDGGTCGTDDLSIPDFISVNPNNPCTALMPEDGSQTLTWCTGTLYDDGGPTGNYQDQNELTTTISPPGATSVTLTFSDFGFEESYDYLYVYDGPNTGSPLIGQYDGFNLPNGGTISSTGGSITLRQSSDLYLNESGFALTWECVQPNSAPTPSFSGNPRTTCSGSVSFTDLSINGATSWLWDFGDGNTSTDQNPTHVYASEGNYTVTLTATNNFGSNVVSQNNYITVDRPDGPVANGDARCDPGSLALSSSGNGTLTWYDQASGGTALGTGSTFNTPSISSTTTYYVADVVPATNYSVGPSDNSFGGGGNFQGDQHLIFDCLEAFTLESVKVYAEGGADRTIELRNSSGTVLQSLTTFIPNGEQTVTLNFNIQPGTDYQLGTTPGPDLYRNNDSPSYPYTVQDVVSITNSSAGTDYYYFFYNWQILTAGCTSERTAVEAVISEAPTTQDADRCGTGSVTLNASGSGDLNWYDSASGGTLVNTGTTFNTPSLNNTTTYYVENEVLPAPIYGGAPDNNFGTGSEFNNIQSLVFDCYEQVTLVSVKVYAFGAGNRTVELRNSGGTVLQSATINIPDGESRITLNFDLPLGTDLQLGTSAAPALYRNNSGPSYPYDISDVVTITSSTAGNDYYYFFYDWEVQKPGCVTARTEVTATINAMPSVSIFGDNSVCEGSSVELTTSSSDADSFSWSTGATSENVTVNPTQETTYSVTATNSCGDATDQITVTIDPLPTISASADQEICEGESVQLTSSSNESVVWQPGGETTESISVSPASDAIYIVSATNNCGTASEDVEVVVNPLPNANAGQDQTICEEETATLTASGGDSYVWDTQETTSEIEVEPSGNTNYSVTVTDANGCVATDDVNVFVNPLPSQPEISVGGSGLTSTLGNSYQWYLDGTPIENAIDQDYEPTQTGEYTVEIFDANGCSSTSGPYSWIAVGIDENEIGLEVYPIPFSSEFNINSSVPFLSVRVLDVSGRIIAEQTVNSSRFSINSSAWANGSYVLQLTYEGGMVQKRLLKSD